MSYHLVAISNGGGAPEQAYRKMQSAGACPERPYAEMFKFEVPSLTVGTLDSLMKLSDDMGKTDSHVESVVRKIERTAFDLSSSRNNTQTVELNVGGVPPTRYIQQFAWDSAKYPNRRSLLDLVQLITSGVASMEEELKQLANSYSDKSAQLQEAQKRSLGNLMSVDLNDVLTADTMRAVTVHDTEYLKTLFIAIPKAVKDVFKNDIYKVGHDLVGYGGPDWARDPTKLGEPVSFGSHVDRHKTRGSPVVPNSLQLVHEDNDSSLFVVTILKSQYEAGYYENDEFQAGTKVDLVADFTKACKDKRYAVREFEWDPDQGSKSSMQLEQLQVEVDGMKSALLRWCKNHFGDGFVAWMHIKVIRVFVESVLRYGLPVDFTAVLYKAHHGKEGDLVDALDKHLGDGTKEKDEDDGDEYHEFVLIKFDP